MIGPGFDDVLAAAQNGDESAFEQLWRDANPAMVRYLRVTSGDQAEDVASETWAYAVSRLHRFRGNEAAWRAWLFTTARRRATDEGRRRSRSAARSVGDFTEIEGDLGSHTDTADVVLEDLGTARTMQLLARLPRMQAEAIVLRVVAGLSAEATGAVLGRTPGAVRVATHRGLTTLASMVATGDVTLPAR